MRPCDVPGLNSLTLQPLSYASLKCSHGRGGPAAMLSFFLSSESGGGFRFTAKPDARSVPRVAFLSGAAAGCLTRPTRGGPTYGCWSACSAWARCLFILRAKKQTLAPSMTLRGLELKRVLLTTRLPKPGKIRLPTSREFPRSADAGCCCWRLLLPVFRLLLLLLLYQRDPGGLRERPQVNVDRVLRWGCRQLLAAPLRSGSREPV